jgi:hypothetical protein
MNQNAIFSSRVYLHKRELTFTHLVLTVASIFFNNTQTCTIPARDKNKTIVLENLRKEPQGIEKLQEGQCDLCPHQKYACHKTLAPPRCPP